MALLALSVWLGSVVLVSAQWEEDTAKYAEVIMQETDKLDALIETHEDVEFIIHPEREQIFTDEYRYARPETEDYIVGIIVDPVSELTPHYSF